MGRAMGMCALCRGQWVGEGKSRPTRPGQSRWRQKNWEEKMGWRTGGADRPPGFRPGGTPEEISRGQVRPCGRRPRKPCRAAPRPSGASKKWPVMPNDHQRPGLLEAKGGGGDGVVLATPKTSPMPRWGMARSAWQLGAAPAGAGLPPANFLRRPSGTKSQASATFLRWSARCQRSGESLARHVDFSWSAAVCAEHQPQQVGTMGRSDSNGCQRGFSGRCGWSSADTAALLGLRLGCGWLTRSAPPSPCRCRSRRSRCRSKKGAGDRPRARRADTRSFCFPTLCLRA